ncbi:PREDICTED: uveal autoantigen with coiled-coil domains and ankyrin repeats-like [Eufriesea mexicana]|uniref:uveal autoantigen with coiled-coil domains and ankyrin repeats-like n=1 Tax=Eufriesea mexicana TaxID=516756 RepID=UPI00083C0EFE|nr:PREDICTED: uveal autoantigen with coiled-coil domains and ankyrin repeats-like [Eufriesea mexicana]
MYHISYIISEINIINNYIHLVEDNTILLNKKQSKNDINETEFGKILKSSNNKNLLNEITNNLDSYEHKKEYHNYIIKLSRKDDIDKIQREIIEYFIHFLIKVRSLTQELEIYLEIERPVMIKQTYYFYEILKDIQSAINNSQDITLKKQLILDLYNQHKAEHKKHDSYIKQFPNNLLQIQKKINEFIENILCQLLSEISHREKRHLGDKKINRAFETHLRSFINRINIILQSTGDQYIQIFETIEEQQKELRKKEVEIAQLKEKMMEQRRGEGDCLNTFEKRIEIKEQLSKVTAELNKKDALILQLEEQLEVFKNKFSIYDNECNALKKEYKNLENLKNRLLKRCQQNRKQLSMKSKQIKNLSQQVQKHLRTKNLKIILKNKIREMEKRFIDLQYENNKLKTNIMQRNIIISTKDKTIINLKNSISKTNNILSQKVTQYENVMEEKHHEIIKLEDENKLLNEKVKDIEHKLTGMNQAIISLTEQNDKINIIYTMQEHLTKLDKNEEKLKVQLNNFRTQLITVQNDNKELNTCLDTYLHENEILKKNVEYWKNENSELSITQCNELIKEELKSKLYILSYKIHENLLRFIKLSNLEINSANNSFIKELQDKYIVHQDQEVVLTIDNTIKDLQLEYGDLKRGIKENEIEDIETELLNNINMKEKMLKNDYIPFEQFNFSKDNLMMKYKIKHLENEYNENQNETKNKDFEIQHPKEIIKYLIQENAVLRASLKSQMEEYQNKLTLMKKNYDSSLNALCERHKANVEILQKQFEDDIKNEKIFDSENWLLSLDMKELMELYERISVILNSNANVIHMQNENQCLYDNSVQQQFYIKQNEMEKEFKILPKNTYQDEAKLKKIVSPVLKEKNTYFNQWQFIASSDIQKYSTLKTQNYKSSLEYNLEYFNNEEKSSELEIKYEKEKQMEKDTTFDQQRWNFINQCSAYHKLSNI